LLLFFVFLAVFVVSNIIYVSLFNLCAGDSTFWDASTQLSRFVFNCSMCVWHSEQLEVALHVAYGSLRAAVLHALGAGKGYTPHTAHTHKRKRKRKHKRTPKRERKSKRKCQANRKRKRTTPHRTRPHQTTPDSPDHTTTHTIHIHTHPYTAHPTPKHHTPNTTHHTPREILL